MSTQVQDTELTVEGLPVKQVVLDDGSLRVTLLSLGARIHDVRLAGVAHPLVVGAREIGDYLTRMAYFGAIVGPVANRISGAAATLDGRTHVFDSNEHGSVTLHSGASGTHAHNWDLDAATDRQATFTLNLRDGEGGFPGNRALAARYTLSGDGLLSLRIAATTDAPTWANFASHAFWNLAPGPNLDGHTLRIDADRYTPADAQALVTGEIAPVEGTPFDFRTPRPVGPGTEPRLDHNFCLADARREVREVLTLTAPGGVTMQIATNEPGIQVFDSAPFDDTDAPASLSGHPAGTYCGLAIEPQGWPDAPNNPRFPSVRLDPGRAYEQVTRFRFFRS